MTQIIKKSKIQMIVILCFGCLFLSLCAVKVTVSAVEKSPYYIKVNKLQNCVTIYEKDKKGEYTIPIKAMTCSTGSATPEGIYNTLVKYRWKLLMGDVWGQYSTRIINGILFHSVWYYDMDETTLSAKQYNKLGTAASHGCVRLTVADAKWIYDNCPVGTTVEIYSDKDPGPLGKPNALLLKIGTGWDPTDPSVKNPYNGKTPTIKASNQSITWGKKIDLRKGVIATSTSGVDISSELTVKGKVDIYSAGKYKIKYSIVDALGRTKEKAVTITVKEYTKKPKFKGIVDRYINADKIVDREFALEGVTAYLSTVKLAQKDIEVDINKDSEDNYTIGYKVTGKNGLIGKAVATVYVDSTPPEMDGISHKELTLEQLESSKSEIEKLALEYITVWDDYSIISNKQVKVTVKAKSDYAYIVTYEVADDVGNLTTETVQFTYFNDVKINGVSNQFNIPYETEITEDYVKQEITATNGEVDCTDKITIKISSVTENVYKVTYSIQRQDGSSLSIVSYYTVDPEPADLGEVTELDQEDAQSSTSENSESQETQTIETPDESLPKGNTN